MRISENNFQPDADRRRWPDLGIARRRWFPRACEYGLGQRILLSLRRDDLQTIVELLCQGRQTIFGGANRLICCTNGTSQQRHLLNANNLELCQARNNSNQDRAPRKWLDILGGRTSVGGFAL